VFFAMNIALGLISLLGFSLSLVAHVFALNGVDIESEVPALWALHVGVFVVFIPMVVQLRRMQDKGEGMAIFRGIPTWAGGALVLLIPYVLVNFISSIGSGFEGSPAILDGQYVLQYKGKLVRVITESEYRAHLADVLRGFSGHWLLFYYLPLTHFLLRRSEESEE
jgi:hypothetical protein